MSEKIRTQHLERKAILYLSHEEQLQAGNRTA